MSNEPGVVGKLWAKTWVQVVIVYGLLFAVGYAYSELRDERLNSRFNEYKVAVQGLAEYEVSLALEGIEGAFEWEALHAQAWLEECLWGSFRRQIESEPDALMSIIRDREQTEHDLLAPHVAGFLGRCVDDYVQEPTVSLPESERRYRLMSSHTFPDGVVLKFLTK
ncbi:hypothetical protein [Ferrimonas marina]|uniref:Uncharacterized protein n=1 Tax=Ferrimonas marina TaxID=299255 RepID=A0A1M5UDU1_9GAMM|nr:hypothetical protein [Ferrimonas marina]SHH61110.1 hypothetical protein SAMN02745129_2519 [Ferrimonas marina]